MNVHDLRVIKTKRNIEASFLKLLTQKDFSEITVQNLLDEALINRSTFYKHYKDKYDLAEQMIQISLEDFKQLINHRFAKSTLSELSFAIEHVYTVLNQKKDSLLSLWTIHTETLHLYEDMQNYLKSCFSTFYMHKFINSPEQLDYFSTMYASLVMSSIEWCITHNYETITEVTLSFIRQLYSSLKGDFFD